MPGYAVLSHPWWVPILMLVLLGHIQNMCTTLYLHRAMSHGGVRFGPVAAHFMRFYLWLTSGAVTREWVAVHRKHHAFPDREGDPHSPVLEGTWNIVLRGLHFYRKAAADPEVLDKYGKGCPDDWVERNVYSAHRAAGPWLTLALCLYLFGILFGLLVWVGLTLWMPMMGQAINGLGHALGYRNFRTQDHSRNLYPWGIWILGEELHNNHHADPRSAKFQARWWEFDVGWIYINFLKLLGQAEIVYARTESVKEFSAKHLRKAVDPLTGKLDRATEKFADAKDRAGEKVNVARDRAGEKIHVARDRAGERITDAKEKIELAKTEARAGLKPPKPSAD